MFLTGIVTIREQLVAMELKGHDKLFADWSASVIELARSDGSTLLVHLHRPPAPTAGAAGSTEEAAGTPLLPLVLWLHGGGYTVGGGRDNVGATYATELLALGRPVAWASVEYRLAPEHPQPAAADDAMLALEYFAAGGAALTSLGIDPRAIHLAGTSAGAGLAAVVASEATAHRGVAVRSLLADEPMLDPRCASPSYLHNSATTIAPVEWLRWSWRARVRVRVRARARARNPNALALNAGQG